MYQEGTYPIILEYNFNNLVVLQTNKVNLLAVIVITFAAGMMTFSTFAYATHDACLFEPTANGVTWDEVWNMLCHLQGQISILEGQLNTIQLLVSSTGEGVYCPALPNDANLQLADLTFTNLAGCDLSYLNFEQANFRFANLQGTNLRYTNLQSAELLHTNLRGADLTGADLSSANLNGADLTGAIITADTNMRCINHIMCTP